MAEVRKKQIEKKDEDSQDVKEVAAPGIKINSNVDSSQQPDTEAEAEVETPAAEPDAAEAAETAETSTVEAQQAADSKPETAEVAEAARSIAEPEPEVESAAEEATESAEGAAEPSDTNDDASTEAVEAEPEGESSDEEEAAEEKPAEEKPAAKKKKSPGFISVMKESSNQRKAMQKARDEAREKRDAEVEEQREKNKVSLEKAMKASKTDVDLDAFDDDTIGLLAEEEDENNTGKLEKKTREFVKPKTRFTEKDNNFDGDFNTVESMLIAQREFFNSLVTRPRNWRDSAVTRLHGLINRYETPLLEALSRDLGISKYEAYLTELAPVHEELGRIRKNIDNWTEKKRGPLTAALFPTRFKTKLQPLGCICIINSWQSPVATAMIALGDALATGNVIILKNSGRCKRTNQVLASMLVEVYKPGYVKFIFGGDDLDQVLINCPFDKVLYVGPRENKATVLQSTAAAGAGVAMLLDGNNPVYVDSSVKVNMAAERIMTGKMLHAGQTRLAPSYVHISESLHKSFINRTYDWVRNTYGNDPIHSKEYPRMFSKREYKEVCDLIDGIGSKEELIYGGERDPKTLRIAPTVILAKSIDAPIFRKKIFGPVLVVTTFKRPEEVFGSINKGHTPPAFYCFTKNKSAVKFMINNVRFGEGCINDTVIQTFNRLTTHGALGDAGMGTIGGLAGLEEFSERKTIAISNSMFTRKFRFQPFPKEYKKLRRLYRYRSN
ncbi:MAG: aldehyde dehydrogenase family protein [Coriobacteriales bacterium]|jgi:aldehyde dehydrogenase (NAD+)